MTSYLYESGEAARCWLKKGPCCASLEFILCTSIHATQYYMLRNEQLNGANNRMTTIAEKKS